MSEANMWAYLQPKLKPLLHCERLTDRLVEGIADVMWLREDGMEGKLELKYLPAYPKVPGTPLLTYGSHGLQVEQAFWLGRWARRGGRAHILLRVGSDDWWLWRAQPEAAWVKDIRAEWANDHPMQIWKAYWRLTAESLVEALCVS